MNRSISFFDQFTGLIEYLKGLPVCQTDPRQGPEYYNENGRSAVISEGL